MTNRQLNSSPRHLYLSNFSVVVIYLSAAFRPQAFNIKATQQRNYEHRIKLSTGLYGTVHVFHQFNMCSKCFVYIVSCVVFFQWLLLLSSAGVVMEFYQINCHIEAVSTGVIGKPESPRKPSI